jgi:ubiquinone/menaquinone biosynthesis C-methylase UbiE
LNQQIPRILESEYMDDPQEATLYDAMDHDHVNRLFVGDLLAAGKVGPRVIDLGTGTARIPIILCGQVDDVRVMAIDAALHMLDIAMRNVDVAGLRDRIQLDKADVKSLADYDDGICDCVISNTLLHHLPEPIAALRQAARIVRRGGRIFIRDLMRPPAVEDVERLTQLHANGASVEAQQLLRQSLHAALTLDEAKQMAEDCGIDPAAVCATSDRHWTLDVIL